MQTLVATVLVLALLRPGAHCCLIPAIGGGAIPASGSWDGAVPMAGVWINKEKKWRRELTTEFCDNFLNVWKDPALQVLQAPINRRLNTILEIN